MFRPRGQVWSLERPVGSADDLNLSLASWFVSLPLELRCPRPEKPLKVQKYKSISTHQRLHLNKRRTICSLSCRVKRASDEKYTNGVKHVLTFIEIF